MPEVWRHDGERLRILLLGEDGYAEAPSSRTFPGLSAELLTRLLAEGRHTPLGRWLRAVRAEALARL